MACVNVNQPACIFSPYEEDIALMGAPVVAATTENDSKIRKNLTTEFAIIQDSKMDVFLRVRPLTSKERREDSVESCLEIQSKKEVLLKAPAMSATFKNNPHNVDRLNTKFTFTEIFGPETTQHDFYLSAVDKTVQQFLDGQNCLIFAYGATNSGKTHTVQGPPDNPGVIPLALDVIFHNLQDNLAELPQYRPISSIAIEELLPKDQRIELEIKESLISVMSEGFHFSSSKDSVAVSQESLDIFDNNNIVTSSKVTLQDDLLSNSTFTLYVSFAEIYNEQLFDLLSHCIDPKKRPKLNLVHDASGNPFIKGLRKIWVSSMEEALKLLQVGRRNLHMAATKLNEQSSRSHCIFSVYVIRVINSNPVLAYINNLSFCDLAGSERVVKTKNTGERLKEAGNINTSLMVLGRCIDILRNNQANPKEKSTNVVPYRDSKITRLFQSFFNGQGKASMIVNVAPNCAMFDDTLKVMKFSALAKQVVSKDQVDRSVLNISSISERLTNFWVKSNRRWSSIAAHCPKQSIVTIPEASTAEWNTLVEDEEEIDEEDDEIDPEQVQDLLHDIKEWTNLSEAQEQEIRELKKKIKELEKQVDEIAKKTKDEDYAFFKEHTETMEQNHKEELERREEIANDILNSRTELLEEYIAKITRKSQTSEDEEDSDNENESTDYDQILKKLEECQQAKEALENENQCLQEKLARLAKSIDNNKEVVDKFNDAQNTIQTLNEEKRELEEKISQLQNKIIGHEEINEKLEEALNTIVMLQHKIYKLQENLDRSQKECIHHDKVLEKLNYAENFIDTLKKEKQELDEKLTQQQDESISLNKIGEKLDEAHNSIETFKKENDQLRQKLTVLQDNSIAFDKISKKLEEARTSIDTFEKENDDLQQKLQLLQDKSIGLDKINEKLEEALTSIETLKNENNELQQKLLLQNKSPSCDEMVLEFESCKDVNKTLKKANKKLEGKITLLKEKTIDHNEILEKLSVAECSSETLRKENSELKANYQKLLEELNLTKSKIEKQSSTLETMKLVQAEERKREISTLEEKETAVRSQLANTSAQLKESQEEFDKLINILLEKDSKVEELTDKVKDLEGKLKEVSKENIRQPKRKATARSTRKQYRPVPETSSEDESSTNPSTSQEKLTEVPVPSRSPLAVLDSVLQQSPTVGAAYNAVKRGFERVTKAFQSPIQPAPSITSSRPKRQTRKLYQADTLLLDTSPSNEASPPKMPRNTVRTASLRTTRSSRK